MHEEEQISLATATDLIPTQKTSSAELPIFEPHQDVQLDPQIQLPVFDPQQTELEQKNKNSPSYLGVPTISSENTGKSKEEFFKFFANLNISADLPVTTEKTTSVSVAEPKQFAGIENVLKPATRI